MSVIIRLQNLPLTATSIDIRAFFRGLSIPDGGVHIVGGKDGDAFIAFSTDEDARQAMALNGTSLQDSSVKLLLSSRNEMFKVIEQARQKALGVLPGNGSSAASSMNQNTNSLSTIGNNNDHHTASSMGNNTPGSAASNNLQIPGAFPVLGMPNNPFGNLNAAHHHQQPQLQQQLGLPFGAHTLPPQSHQLNNLVSGHAGAGPMFTQNSLVGQSPAQTQHMRGQQQQQSQAPTTSLNPFLFPQAQMNHMNLQNNQMNPNLMQQFPGINHPATQTSILGQPPDIFKANHAQQGIENSFGPSQIGKPRDGIGNNSRNQSFDGGFRNQPNRDLRAGGPNPPQGNRFRSRFDQVDEEPAGRDRGFPRREDRGGFRGRGGRGGPSGAGNSRRSRSRSRERRRRRSASKERTENGSRIKGESRRRRSTSRSRDNERTSSRDDKDKRIGRIGSKRRDSSKDRERGRNISPRRSTADRSESDDCLVIDIAATENRDAEEARDPRLGRKGDDDEATDPRLSRFDSDQQEGDGLRSRKVSRFDAAPAEGQDLEHSSRRRDRSRFDDFENGTDSRGDRDRRDPRDRNRNGFDGPRSERFDQEPGGNRDRLTRREAEQSTEAKSLLDLRVGPEFESSTVIVHSVPPNANEREIGEFFGDIGLNPIRIKILFDQSGSKTGSVICEFRDSNKALRATTKDGTMFGRNKITVKMIPDKLNSGGPRAPFGGGRGGRGGMRGGFGRGVGGGGPRFPAPINVENSDNPFIQALQAATDASSRPMNRLRNPLNRGSFRGGRPGAGIRPSLPEQSPELSDDGPDLGYFERPGCVVAVANIPFAATTENIVEYLEELLEVPVNRDRIIRRFNENKRPTGDARIAFDTPEEAKQAHDLMAGTSLWNRAIQVSIPRQF